MAIVFSCVCGKHFRAQEKHAGKQMRCKNCGATVAIPEPTTAAEIEDVTEVEAPAPAARPEPEGEIQIDEQPPEPRQPSPFEEDWLSRLEALTREQQEELIEAPLAPEPDLPDDRAGPAPAAPGPRAALPTDEGSPNRPAARPAAGPLEALPAEEGPAPARRPARRYNPLLDGPRPRTESADNGARPGLPGGAEAEGQQAHAVQRRYNPLLDGPRPDGDAEDTEVLRPPPPPPPVRRFPWRWVLGGVALLALLVCLAGGALVWSLLNRNTAADVGFPTLKGTTTRLDDQSYDVVAGGKGIWGEADQLHFYGRPMSGDFDLQVHVAFAPETVPTARAGLMAREGLDPLSRNVAMLAIPGEQGSWMQLRPTPAGMTVNFKGKDPGTPQGLWVRLSRVGNEFTGYSSPDGKSWNQVHKQTLDLPGKVYVGLAATSGDEKTAARVWFRNFGSH
jgi:hypothetical protein